MTRLVGYTGLTNEPIKIIIKSTLLLSEAIASDSNMSKKDPKKSGGIIYK